MRELVQMMPRSCIEGGGVCDDTGSMFGFDAGPVLFAIFAIAVIGSIVVIVMGVRRRERMLKDYAAEHPSPGAMGGDEPSGDRN